MSDCIIEDDLDETVTEPRKRRVKNAPIRPGQYLLNKPQMLQLCGDPSYSTVWLWMVEADFPKPIELGPPGGRTTRVAWIMAEVLAWLQARPRRAIGNLKQRRAAQETGKAKPPPRDRVAALGAAIENSGLSKPRAASKPASEPPKAVRRRLSREEREGVRN